MIVRQASLRKILQIFAADDRQRISLLRRDIAESRRPPTQGGGGDFHSPFWSDAKSFVRGNSDLRAATEARIERNYRRSNLYPRLMEGFLRIASEGRRLRNEDYVVSPTHPHGNISVDGAEGVIKVQDTLQLQIEGVGLRTVYPYFAEVPALGAPVARLGLWAMARALQRPIEEMRIIDILRAETYSTRNAEQRGDEEGVFLRRYTDVCQEWHRLAEERR